MLKRAEKTCGRFFFIIQINSDAYEGMSYLLFSLKMKINKRLKYLIMYTTCGHFLKKNGTKCVFSTLSMCSDYMLSNKLWLYCPIL